MAKTHDMIGMIGELLEYMERFADLNDEPQGGHCRETIRRAEAWRETGCATVDPVDATAELLEYVERFADENDEPPDGDCRRLIARARGVSSNIQDVLQARQAYLRAADLVQGAETVAGSAPECLVRAMRMQAGAIGRQVDEWSGAQPEPEAARALAHGEFWKLDVDGRLC